MTASRAFCLALAGLCLASVCGLSARAADPRGQGGLGEVLFGSDARDDRRASVPHVGRYMTDDGATFVLDRSATVALLRFDKSCQVLELKPIPAARGDTIYRDGMGAPVLRMTRLGGVTLFAPGRPGGAPMALMGSAAPIHFSPMAAGDLGQRFLQSSVRASKQAGHLVIFDAPEITPGSEALLADAAAATVEAMARMSRRKDGKKALQHLRRVLFQSGPTAIRLDGATLEVTIDPCQGAAVRTSSDRIVQAALRVR